MYNHATASTFKRSRLATLQARKNARDINIAPLAIVALALVALSFALFIN